MLPRPSPYSTPNLRAALSSLAGWLPSNNWALCTASIFVLLGLVLGASPASALDYFALDTPCVAFDTRSTDAPPLGNGVVRTVALAGAGRSGIPASAQALAVNFTVFAPTQAGFLVAYPADQPLPVTSAINFSAGQTRSNSDIVPLAQNGSGTLALVAGFAAGNKATVNVVMEVRGCFSADTAPIVGTSQGPLRFETVTGCRLADTRVYGGPLSGLPPYGNETRDFVARGYCGIPADAAGAWVNLTAVSPTQAGTLTLHSSDLGWPPGPTLQLSASVPVIGNGVLTTLSSTAGADLKLTYEGSGQVDAVLDTNAYLIDHGGAPFTPITPCRAVDTRASGPIPGLTTRTFGLRPACPAIPEWATAVAANVTVVGPTGPGFLTVFPAGGIQPPTSAINFAAGEPALGNGGIYAIPVAAPSSFELSVFAGMPVAGTSTQVVVDVYGYFGSQFEGNAEADPGASGVDAFQERGVSPSRMYQVDAIESVNLFNGNVNISFPVGPRLPVGGELSYGFELTYNSKVFDQKEVRRGTAYRVQAVPFPANAGLGWNLSLAGSLEGPAPDEQGRFTYHSQDGSSHTFYETLNRYNGSAFAEAEPGVYYTRDSTYLRLKFGSSVQGFATATVEMPNGMVHRFAYRGWQSPSGKNEPKWRLTKIEDPFGNWVAIDYDHATEWVVTDSTGRGAQHVYFVADPQLDAVVSQLQVQTVGGSAPLYNFLYANQDVNPGTLDTDRDPAETLSLPFLERLQLPDGASFGTTILPGTATDASGGIIQQLTLPYGGSIDWTYQTYNLPVAGCSPRNHLGSTPGVRERTFRTADGAVAGRWLYEQTLSSTVVTPIPVVTCDRGEGRSGFPARSARAYAIRKVTTPLNDSFVAYYSTVPDPQDSRISWPAPYDFLDYGLPFSRHQTAGDGTLYLSRETYDCDSNGANCQLDRSEYVHFERDREQRYPNDEARHASQSRLSSSRTVFARDGNRYKETVYGNFDGLGHYRFTTERGNFQPNDHDRTTIVKFNPNSGTYQLDANSRPVPGVHTFQMPASTAPWVLGTYDERTANSGTSTVRELYCFNGSTGFLNRKRVRYNPESSTNRDVLIAYTPDANGNLTREAFYGADDHNAPNDTCGTIPGTTPPSFIREHTYTAGVLRSSRYRGVHPATDFYTVDRDIDLSSGLPLVVRDSAGLPTELTYDLMGRLTQARPTGTASGVAGRAAWTEISYLNADQNCDDSQRTASGLAHCAHAIVRRRTAPAQGGAIRSQSEVYFDGLGREVLSRRSLPGPDQWATTITNYDGMNQKTFVSVPGSLTSGTQYLDYDPYGRPGQVRSADGHLTSYAYGGTRSISRTVKIGQLDAGGNIVEADATTTETYDSLGRLVSVKEPAAVGPQPAPGTCNLITCPVLTNYEYDVADRLTEVTTQALEGTQHRTFSYDGLGFLRTEDRPELQAPSGHEHDREFLDYSPLGHPKRVIDGSGDRTLSYDWAGRMLAIQRTSDAAPLVAFTYDERDGSRPGASNGKPVRASRFNYRDVFTLEVRQDFDYYGTEGAPSARVMRLITGGVAHEKFTQTFSYNDLGDPSSVRYPTCDFAECPPTVPSRTIDVFYDQGLPVAISGYASALKYHPNGSLFRVEMTNGQAWQQDADPNLLPRPLAICIKSNTNSSSCGTSGLGPYQYDGLGDVVKIGTESYSYDLMGRLVWAEHDAASGGRDRQVYSYDGFGNLKGIDSNLAQFSRSIPVDPATNHLAGNVSYDQAGNLKSWNGHLYDYDELGMMSRSRNADLGYTYFLYDASGERVLNLTPAVAGVHDRLDRWTLRDLGGKVLRVLEATAYVWQWKGDYVYQGSALLAKESPGTSGTARFFIDHLGTPRQIFDGNGGRAHHYFPYGEEYSGGDAEVMKFTGHERDLNDPNGVGDDLDYMHARYYNPMLGRFLSPDPAASNEPRRGSRAWNQYLYADASPIRFADPTGRAVPPCREDAGTSAYPNGCDFTPVSKDTSGYRRLASGPAYALLAGLAGPDGVIAAIGGGTAAAGFGSNGTPSSRFFDTATRILVVQTIPLTGRIATLVKSFVSGVLTALAAKQPGNSVEFSKDGKFVTVTSPKGTAILPREVYDKYEEEGKVKNGKVEPAQGVQTSPGEQEGHQ